MDAKADGGAPRETTEANATSSDRRSTCGSDLESTATLVLRARAGDSHACNRLFERYFHDMKRWAHGRLPAGARDLSQTEDLVQISMLRALEHLEGFEPRYKGSFHAYLRSIVINQVRDEIRRSVHRPRLEQLSDELAGGCPSPLEETATRQSLEAYEKALAKLPERTRQAVALRLELGLAYRDVARRVGCPSPNAARMLIARALVQMAEEMHGTEDTERE